MSLHDERWKSFESILRHVCRTKQPKNIAEWGPGLSTRVMHEECPDAKIFTVEHDKKYFAKACLEWADNPKVETHAHVISMAGGKSTGYVTAPLAEYMKNGQKPYDLIFIDGRFRADCILVAMQCIAEDGIVIVHDAHRESYQSTGVLWPYQERLAGLRTMVLSKSPLKPLFRNEVQTKQQTLDELALRFADRKPFTYLRFGDADLFFMQDEGFTKNKRHDPDPRLSSGLRTAFEPVHPDYMVGTVVAGGVFKGYQNELQNISQNYHWQRMYYSAARAVGRR